MERDRSGTAGKAPGIGEAAVRKAVFIDRDGTINELVYNAEHGIVDSPHRVQDVRLIEGAAQFIRGVKDLGYLVIVVTNQPGVAKGSLTLEELESIHERLKALLGEQGAQWDDLLYCPHHPRKYARSRTEYVMECDCRKPAPGLLLAGARKHNIDLGASWMVGDGLSDVQAGRRAGCHTILVTRLKIETIERFLALEDAEPEYVAGDLAEALEVIRKCDSERSGR